MSDFTQSILFSATSGKEVVANFDGGDITSDSGMLLLADADRRAGVVRGLSEAIDDRRQSGKVEHPMATLVAERVFAIAAGYEDANDLSVLRSDPALKIACGRAPKTDGDLAGQSTVSRLENSVGKKDLVRMGLALARSVVAQLPASTGRVVLDLDAMEDPCHGQQEFELFNGFYDSHCYLPLLMFVTDEVAGTPRVQRLMGVLLRGGKPGNEGVAGLVGRAVRLLRERFPKVEIDLRADAGFGNDSTLRLCDRLGIGYVLGLAGNERLQTLSTPVQMRACCKYTFEKRTWQAAGVCREFGSFDYEAGSWDKRRRVVVKAEITRGQLNPRFVVTSRPESASPESVYANYCERGDRENRIKEFKLDLSGGRTSCHRFLANQFRVLLHAAAAVLMGVLQEAAAETSWANAQVGTLRLRLLKLGARVVESSRKIWLHLSSSYPDKEAWNRVHAVLSG